MALKFRRGTTAQKSGSLAYGEPYVNTTLGTLQIGGEAGDITLLINSSSAGISGSSLDITGNAKIDGNLRLGGNITIGDQTTDTVNVVANLSSSLIPSVNNAFDLGSSTKIWRDLYLSTGSIKLVDGSGVVVNTITNANIVTTDTIASGSVTLTNSLPTGVVSSSAQVVNILNSLNSYTASNDTTNSTQNSRLDQLSTDSGSQNTRITNLETKATTLQTYTASVNGHITDINTYTSSNDTTNTTQNTRLTALEASASTALSTNNLQSTRVDQLAAATASVNSFTSSINTTIKSKLDTDGVVSGSSQITLSSTTGFTSYSSSVDSRILTEKGRVDAILLAADADKDSFAEIVTLINSVDTTNDNTFASFYTASNGRLNNLESTSASVNGHVSDINTKTGSFETKFSTLQTYTASVNGHIADINAYTASNNTTNSSQTTRIDQLAAATASVNSFTSSINTTIKTKLNVEGVISGSSQLSGTTISNLSGSFTGSFKGNVAGVADYAQTTAVVTTGATTDNTLYPIFSSNPSPNSYITPITHPSGSFYYNGASRKVYADTFVGGIEATNGIVSGSAQIVDVLSSLNSYTSSNDTTNTLQSTRIDQLAAATASVNSFTSSENTKAATLALYTASVETKFSTLQTYTASVNGHIADINAYTASNNTTNTTQNGRLNNLESTSASVNSSINNINSFTASNGNTSLNSYTGSLNAALSVTGSKINFLGDIVVWGTQSVISSQNLAVADNMIYLNDGSTVTDPDLGIAGNYNDGVYRHTGIFSDASDGHAWKVFKAYTPEPSGTIDTTHGSFALADFKAGAFTGTSFSGQILATNGVVSGSSQVDATATTNWSTGIKTQLNTNTVVSGSSQINLGSAAGNIALSTQTTGDYVASLVAGTNITLSNNSGEGATPTIGLTNNSITIAGQSTALGSSVTAETIRTAIGTVVTGSGQISITGVSGYDANKYVDHTTVTMTAGSGLIGGGTIAATRTFSVDSGSMLPYYSSSVFSRISGDLAINSVGFATIQPNSVALGSDTTGDYVASLVAGTNITLSNNAGEGATPTIGLTNNAITIAGQSTSLGGTITAETIRTAIGTVVTGSSQINFTQLSGISNGIISSSAQIDALFNLDGIVSGSSQIDVSSTTGDIALGTRTSGNYVATITAGTGVSTTGATTGEGIAHTISIGQSVATSASPTFAGLTINGAITATGDITAYYSSDKRYKNNIQPITDALAKVRTLNGVTWEWNDDVSDVTKAAPKTGLIAQEVQAVLPEVVKEKEDGYLGLDYAKMMGLMVEAIKEQQLQIEKLQLEVVDLKRQKGL